MSENPLDAITAILSEPASRSAVPKQRLGLNPKKAEKTVPQLERPATGAQRDAQLSSRAAVSEPQARNTGPDADIEELEALTGGAGRDDADGGDPPGDGDEQVLDVEAGDGASTLKALAEKLGVDAADLYKLRIPMGGDGGSMSLGELKDIGQRSAEVELQRVAFEEAVQLHRVAAVREREEVTQLLGMLPPGAFSKAMIETARARAAEERGRQGTKLLQLVPEWSEPLVYQADQALMATHAKANGFEEHELAGLLDARLLAYIRRNARRDARIKELLERQKGAPAIGRGFKKNGTAVKAAQAERSARAARTGSQAEKLNLIDQILRDTQK